jgi:hypothetical protein
MDFLTYLWDGGIKFHYWLSWVSVLSRRIVWDVEGRYCSIALQKSCCKSLIKTRVKQDAPDAAEEYSLRKCADDITDLALQLGETRIVVCGHDKYETRPVLLL